MDEYEITIVAKQDNQPKLSLTITTKDLASLSLFIADVQRVVESK